MPEAVLRRWCEPGYFFFVTWKGDEVVSYRCLSTYVHPGVDGFVRRAVAVVRSVCVMHTVVLYLVGPGGSDHK